MPLVSWRRVVVGWTFLSTIALWGSSAVAQAPGEEAILEETPRVVIQNRRFNLGTEFSAATGILPLDPFYRSLHLGGRITQHLGQHHAIEAGGLYAFNIPTSLRDQLRDNFAVEDTRPGVEQPLFVADAAYVVKPFYGKLSLFNRSLLYNELYLSIGGGVAGFARGTELIPFIGPGAGGGVRVFLTDFFSLRLDLRHFIFAGTAFNQELQEDELLIKNVMNFSVGLSLNFGGG